MNPRDIHKARTFAQAYSMPPKKFKKMMRRYMPWHVRLLSFFCRRWP